MASWMCGLLANGAGFLFFLLLLLMPATASFAEEADEIREELKQLRERLQRLEEAKEEERPAASEDDWIELSLDRGLRIQTSDGKHSIQIGGRVHTDGRFVESDHPTTSTFAVHKARLAVEVTLWEWFSASVEASFGEETGGAALKEAVISFQPLDEIGVVAGYYGAPFSFEDGDMSSNYIPFIYRPIGVFNLSTADDPGAGLFGSLFEGFVNYHVGIFNGPGGVASDNNDEKDVSGRIRFSPLVPILGADAAPSVHVGFSGIYGRQRQSLAGTSFTTHAGTPFLTFNPNTRLFERRIKLGTDISAFVGPLLFIAEWQRYRFDELERGLVSPLQRNRIDADAYSVSVSWVVTGERRTKTGLSHAEEGLESESTWEAGPAHPFDPAAGGWGAVELGFRWHQLDFERDIVGKGYATGTPRVDAFTFGVTWWLRANVRLMLNYERVHYADELNRPKVLTGVDEVNNEDVVFLRFQIHF